MDIIRSKKDNKQMIRHNITGRERVISMLKSLPVDRLPLMPITMQFAGNLIGADYLDYVSDYRVLVKGQIETARKFGFDHVSAISDPTREAADLGADVIFKKGAVPSIAYSNAFLEDKAKLAGLTPPCPYSPGRMKDRVKAIESFKEKVGDELFIEGWVEGPCAEAADLRGINTLLMDFIDDTDFIYDLLTFTNELAWEFARAQIDAGADIIGIGDAVCSLIGPKLYKDFVWHHEKKLIERIQDYGCMVRLHICGNITDLLDDIALLGCELVDIDHMVSLETAREKLGDNQVISGNMDPVSVLRDMPPEDVFKELRKCHQQAGDKFIIAAGCEIVCDTEYSNVHKLLEYSLSKQLTGLPAGKGQTVSKSVHSRILTLPSMDKEKINISKEIDSK